MIGRIAQTASLTGAILALAACGGSSGSGNTTAAAPGGGTATVSVRSIAGAGKVLVDARGDALYFSRSPIPFVRDARDAREAAAQAVARGLARKHVGLYAYRRDALLRFASLPPAPLERAESLEQLRARTTG